MNEQPPIPRLTPLWLFIIGVLVIESAIRLLPEGFMTRTLQHRAEEIRYLPATPIQLMGDSVSSAVRAAMIEQFIGAGPGHEVSNYSLPGTSPMFNYFVLRRQLAAGEAPKLIVFAPHPCTWRDPFVDRFLARFADPGEAVQLARDGAKASDWLYGLLCRASYTLRYREELYLALTQGDTGFFKTWGQPVTSVQNTRAKITAAEQQPPRPGTALDGRNLPPTLTKPIAVHRNNEYYFDQLCDLAAKHDIRVLWLTLPEPELFRRQFPGPERAEAYAPFVRRMSARHPNLFPLTADIPTLPDDHYMDVWHLNRYGAWVFSRQAAEQIAGWLKQHPL
jgi:hypothetical protein